MRSLRKRIADALGMLLVLCLTDLQESTAYENSTFGVDITNECLSGTHNCSRNATCKDTSTGFTCSCNQGYTGNGHDCADIDECAVSLCQQNASCVNAQGSYKCICEAGYNYTGHNCSDVDECVGINQCHNDSNCTNAIGNYQCDCKPGFTGDGYNCSDINECELFNCTGGCYNDRGGFYCNCDALSGWGRFASTSDRRHYLYYTLSFDPDPAYNNSCAKYSLNCASDGSKCVCNLTSAEIHNMCTPIDPCLAGIDRCSENADCVIDYNGSYSCKCNKGFTGDGLNCTDIDECLSIPLPCTNCSNTNGGYSCGCEPGFTGDLCRDIDECAEGIHKCHPRATCTNTEGSYNCTCQDDYYIAEDDGTWCSGCPNNAWSKWLDSDLGHSYWHSGKFYSYSQGNGDHELRSVIKKRFPNLNICTNPTNAEAQQMNGGPYQEAGDVVHMSIEGLWCADHEQLYQRRPHGKCANYIVRFCCPENELPASASPAIPSGDITSWFRSSDLSTLRKHHKCSYSTFVVQWVKSVTENSFYNYKLMVKDVLTNVTKITSVEILFGVDPTIDITESKAKPGFCRTQTRLKLSDNAEAIVDLTVGSAEGGNIATVAKVLHKYPTNTYTFIFFDGA